MRNEKSGKQIVFHGESKSKGERKTIPKGRSMVASSSSTIGRYRRRVVFMRQPEEEYKGPTRCYHHVFVDPWWTSWTEGNLGRRFYGCRNYYQVLCLLKFILMDAKNELNNKVSNWILKHFDGSHISLWHLFSIPKPRSPRFFNPVRSWTFDSISSSFPF